jgi:fermentation-respiration switch protein FrsA (DUF1100 family)
MASIPVYIFIFLLMLMAGLLVIARYLERAAVFFPRRGIAVLPSMIGMDFEDVYYRTQDNLMLNGWFFKDPQAASTLIFAHGNAGNIGDRIFKIKFFHDLGLNVFIFDYRGYGKSEGRPSEKGIYLDAQGAYDYLKERGDVDMNKIIVYGTSLGGVVAVDLAVHRPAALLVVESSITSAPDMARVFYPFVPWFFLSLKFDSIGKVMHLNTPKLFIHSPEDEVVPYWIGQKLFEAASQPKIFMKIHGGHNDASMTADPAACGAFIRILKEKDLI